MAPRTRAELAAALDRRGVPPAAGRRVLDRFAEVGLVDDTAFAAAWVSSRHTGRGLARRALRDELQRKGVPPEVAAGAADALDDETERATARRLVDRRLSATRGLPAPVRIRRLAGMLARKGYPGGLALAVVRDALAADGEPDVTDAVDHAVDHAGDHAADHAGDLAGASVLDPP